MTPPLPKVARGAAAHLKASDPILAGVIERVGKCVLEAPPAGVDIFQSLLRSIIYQQLHGKAAAAIHARVLALAPEGDPAELMALPDEALRGAGLSANKLLAVRDLARKTLDGSVPTAEAAASLSDDEMIERISAVRGIGPWTVQMLLIFHLGHPDVLPTGDFAINKAFSLLYRRGRPVKPAAIILHAKRWQPYRSLASWYLWRSLDTPVLRETPS